MGKAIAILRDAQISKDPKTGAVTATIDGSKFEVSADGATVITYCKYGTAREITAAASTSEDGPSNDRKEVSANGVIISKATDGSFIIAAPETTSVYPNIQRSKRAAPKVGELTEDGVYIGRFADKGGEERDYYADKDDLRNRHWGKKRFAPYFNEVAERIEKLRSFGKNDWTLPTGWHDSNGAPDILGALYEIKGMFNKRKDGVIGFDETGDRNLGHDYLSSSPSDVSNPPSRNGDPYMKVQRFNDGYQSIGHKFKHIGTRRSGNPYVRPVRSVSVYSG